MMEVNPKEEWSREEDNGVSFSYTNYRNETAPRFVRPLEIRFGSSEWHPQPQWLLKAYDFDKKELREFAMKDIQDWMCLSPPHPI